MSEGFSRSLSSSSQISSQDAIYSGHPRLRILHMYVLMGAWGKDFRLQMNVQENRIYLLGSKYESFFVYTQSPKKGWIERRMITDHGQK